MILKNNQTSNLNKPITPTDIEAVIKSLSSRKSQEPDGFSAVFFQTLKEVLAPVLLILLYKIEIEEVMPNKFYEAAITMTQFT